MACHHPAAFILLGRNQTLLCKGFGLSHLAPDECKDGPKRSKPVFHGSCASRALARDRSASPPREIANWTSPRSKATDQDVLSACATTNGGALRPLARARVTPSIFYRKWHPITQNCPALPIKQEGEGCHGHPDGDEGTPPPDPKQISLNSRSR